jgi:hypothetical protein
MPNLENHPANRQVIGLDYGLMHSAQSEGTNGIFLVLWIANWTSLQSNA